MIYRKGFIATFPSSVIPGSKVNFCIRFVGGVNEAVNLTVQNHRDVLFEPVTFNIPSNG